MFLLIRPQVFQYAHPPPPLPSPTHLVDFFGLNSSVVLINGQFYCLFFARQTLRANKVSAYQPNTIKLKNRKIGRAILC